MTRANGLHTMTFFICILASLLWLWPDRLLAEKPVGMTREEAVAAGERMYREGILPDGTPMKALVMGDIPVDGKMFTCNHCHQRSGLGSEEGTIITWPTNGKELFIPRRRAGAFRPAAEDELANPRRRLPKYFQIEDERPAYTDRTLARVLRVGVNSDGRRLSPIMPRYPLSDEHMEVMVYYLKNLSVEYSPGVDDSAIRFATVITDDVSEEMKTAMLSVLTTHIKTHNSLSRHEDKRAAAGPFYKTERHKAFRKLDLDVWELHGPKDTWRAQLDDYYRANPVFALIGGISGGSWEEIHAFSEENEIPCVFPLTDLPVVSDTDWYTLYYSKGYYQEGESAAKFLRAQLDMAGQPTVVQIYEKGDARADALAQGFAGTWNEIAEHPVRNVFLEKEEQLTELQWKDLLGTDAPLVLLFWFDNTSDERYRQLGVHGGRAAQIIGSATLLDHDYSILPDQVRQNIILTYPANPPGQEPRRRFVVERWLEARKIPLIDFDIQAKMYFLGWMLPGAIKSLRSEFFRDYFLERYDMMIDQDYAVAVYPRLTFGPGQRYASKGCYLARVEKTGTEFTVVPVSDWVIH